MKLAEIDAPAWCVLPQLREDASRELILEQVMQELWRQ